MLLVLFILFLASAASYKPVPPVKCGVNEYAVPCKTICPPQNCDVANMNYLCDPNPKCIPGCDCIENHLRNDEKICVFKDKCPGLLSLTEDTRTNVSEISQNTSMTTNVQERRLASGITESSIKSLSNVVLSSQSSASINKPSFSFNNRTGGGNMKRDCTYNSCTPTCSLPNPPNCPENSNPCNCPPGSIISEEGGKCIPREECHMYANCYGDYNASYVDCPISCPSTCAKPDAEYCNNTCETLGCACNPGYLLSEINGTCIRPEDCPGGNACGLNETFVDCLNKCPNIYCPVNDSLDIVSCDPPLKCPSGCSCQKNYRRKSVDEYICILASDCPPVNCTRPNEVWNSCPEPCLSDHCSERLKVTKPGDCPYSGLGCKPQCICKQGFYRNGNDTCVTAQECPSHH